MPELSNGVYLFSGLAIIVFIIEMFTMSFYAFFVSIGSALVALLLYFEFPLLVALCVGSALSILSFVVFHRLFHKKMFPKKKEETPFANLVGERGHVSESIPGQGFPGAVVLSGTAWRALAEKPIAAGCAVVVTHIDGEDHMTVCVQEIDKPRATC